MSTKAIPEEHLKANNAWPNASTIPLRYIGEYKARYIGRYNRNKEQGKETEAAAWLKVIKQNDADVLALASTYPSNAEKVLEWIGKESNRRRGSMRVGVCGALGFGRSGF